jgi:parallel beta-helix repeat protein
MILIIGMMATVDLSIEIAPKVSGTTFTVDDSGGAHFTKIQDAIDVAHWGDTVYVYNGTYNEHIIIDQSIDIIGENNETTVIEGTYFNDVVTIIGDNVNLIGFKIMGNNNDGIILNDVKNCIISNNIITNNDNGISLISSNGNEIINNIISNHWIGIYLSNSDGNTISGNDVSSGDSDGIIFISSNLNTISGNTLSLNLYNHVILKNSNNNVISDNSMLGFGYGINLYNSIVNTISSNIMTTNGIFIEGNQIEYWNTHNIDTSNILDGNPIYYWKNLNGGSIPPSDSGQILLANCTNVLVNDQYISGGNIVGILLGFSSNNTFDNITVFSWSDSIIFFESGGNKIINSKIVTNGFLTIRSISSDNIILINSSLDSISSICNLKNSHVTLINSSTQLSDDIIVDTVSTLTRKWFLHVNVTDSQGNPIPNAKVNIKDNQNGDYNKTFITNTNGKYNWIPQTEYIEKKSGKIYYTPHQISAWNDTLIGHAYPDPVMDQSKTVNIVLYNGTQLDLETGWNLVSLPRSQSNTDIVNVLQSIEGRFDALQWYDSNDVNDPWKHHQNSKPQSMNDLKNLDSPIGFWLHVTDPQGTSLVVFGDESTSSQTIGLKKGWNMVGYPSLTNHNRTTGLNTLKFGTEVDAIQYFDSSTETWHFLEEGNSFEIGRGYWFHATTDCIWEVPL